MGMSFVFVAVKKIAFIYHFAVNLARTKQQLGNIKELKDFFQRRGSNSVVVIV